MNAETVAMFERFYNVPQYRPRRGGYVYFVRAGDGPIKIGWARNPAQRLRELQVAHPYRLAIVAMTRGGERLERRIHEELAEHRLSGEWFEASEDVLAVVSRYSARPDVREENAC